MLDGVILMLSCGLPDVEFVRLFEVVAEGSRYVAAANKRPQQGFVRYLSLARGTGK
jgi:hypothetical protein